MKNCRIPDAAVFLSLDFTFPFLSGIKVVRAIKNANRPRDHSINEEGFPEGI